jgi:D-alanine--poly(phosphoribitol) ligase subunit 1
VSLDLLARIEARALATPSRVAHMSGDRHLTYGELLRQADALAGHLRAALPADRSPVVVLGHKEPELLVAFLGCVRSGHPYVPTETALPRQRVERIVELSAAQLVLTPDRVAELAAEDPADGRPTDAAPAPLGPDDPFYIMFTSGSTGEPKGVPITARGLTHFLDWMLAEQAFGDGSDEANAEVFLNQVPYSFDVSVMDTYTSLLTGGTVCSITRDDIANPKQLYQTLRASNVTTWVSTPSFAQLCLVERTFGAEMLPRLRRFLFCGETLPHQVATQLLDRFPTAEVWNTYGPTEATVAVTSIRVDRELLARYNPLPIGRAMPGTRVAVLGEGDRVVAPGERGELVIAGPNVSPGYLRRPDLTERAFFELDGQRAYRTGDWGREQDGLLFCEGRIDNQVKLHGHRVELGDVEANLHCLPGVRDAVVAPVTRGGSVDSLAAFVILERRPEGSDFEIANDLRARLAERLPAYMLPRRFRFLETFPMTPNGKADRRKLAESLA